jgi:nucleoside-diphosphate-sugar epimerase
VLGFGLELLLIHKFMTTSGSIFLAGASRGVGHQIARILATQNLPVLALIRDPAAQSDLQALNVETVVGDALNPTDVTNAMTGQIISAIVSTIGGMPQDGQRADFLGNKHLIDAAVKNGVSRFILVSSIGAGDTKDAIPATAYAALASVLADKEKAEQYLIDSGLNYTIVRPGGLKSEPATGNGVLTLDTHVAGSITRSDVATLVCRCLASDAAQNQVLSAFDKNMVYGTATYQEFVV